MKPGFSLRVLFAILLTAHAARSDEAHAAPPQPARKVPLRIDESLTKADPVDPQLKGAFKTYRVELLAKKNVVIDVVSKDFDTFLRLQDAAGNVIAQDDDGGEGTNSQLFFTSAKDDTYRLVVASFDRNLGAFHLNVRETTDDERSRQRLVAEWRAVNSRGMERYRKGDFAGARAEFDESLKRAEKLASAEARPEQSFPLAVSLNNLGALCLSLGDYPQSEAHFREVLKLRKMLYGGSPQGHPDLALSFHNLGSALQGQAKFDEAESAYREAVKIYKNFGPKFHADLARSLVNVGTTLTSKGEIREAEPFHRDGLKILRTLFPQGDPQLAHAMLMLGYALHLQGSHEEAESLHREALPMLRAFYPKSKFPNGHPELAICLNGLGNILSSRNQFAESEVFYREALAMRRALFPSGHPDLAETLSNFGLSLQSQGILNKSIELQTEALQMTRALYPTSRYPQGHPNIATRLNNLGLLQNALGAFAQAETNFRASLRMREDLYPKDRFPSGNSDLALALNNLAFNLAFQGYSDQAEALHRDALEMRQKLFPESRFPNGHSDVAESLNNLGFVTSAQGDQDRASTYFRRALEIYQRLYPKNRYPLGHEQLATAFNNLGVVYQDQKDFAKAEDALRQALTMTESLYPKSRHRDGHPSIARNLHNLGAIKMAQNSYADADTFLRAAWKMRETIYGAGHPDLVISLSRLALLQHARGEDAQAEDFADKASQSFRTARVRVGFSGMDRVAFAASDPTSRILAAIRAKRGKSVSAWNAFEQDLGQGLLDDLVSRRQRPLQADESLKEEKLLARLSFLDRRISELLDATDKKSEDLARLRTERETLLLELGQFLSHLETKYGPVAGEVYDLARIQRQMSTHTAIIGWLDAAGSHWAVVVRSQGDPVWVRLSDNLEWTKNDDELPGELRSVLTRYDANIDWEAIRDRVRRQRLTPLVPHLQGIRHIVVLPSSKMAGIPIETLSDRYHVSYAPSATIYAWLRENQKQLPAGNLLAVGDSFFSAKQANDAEAFQTAKRGERFRPLPGSAQEIALVTEIVEKNGGKSERLVGKNASLANLDKMASDRRLAGFRYIHLATHGKALPDRGLSSFLALTSEDPTQMDYAKLSASQILKTWKLNADLVTLSACQTALGQEQGGEGYLGFSQALLLSGARTLVLSQWSVSDHASTLLMMRFYENLQKGSMTKLEALEDARRWLRELPRDEAVRRLQGAPADWIERIPAEDRPFTHPTFWAAFILVGDPGISEPKK